jgi:glycosyltransferase involved in cell wall biosynthesis
MSQHTKEFINFELDNLFADNLHVVSPIPMIGEIKRKIRLAYVSNSYSDGRKRESLLIEFLTKVDPEWLQISLMGIGLEAVHEALFDNSIETVYTNYFDITKYNELLRSCDYFIYLGLDEGAISILDAVAAGVKVITTNQGFHREIKSSRVNFVESADDFRNILNGEISEKIAQRNGSRYGQWNNFASQHLQIWRRMLDGEA